MSSLSDEREHLHARRVIANRHVLVNRRADEFRQTTSCKRVKTRRHVEDAPTRRDDINALARVNGFQRLRCRDGCTKERDVAPQVRVSRPAEWNVSDEPFELRR
jgi:hypothetical protein